MDIHPTAVVDPSAELAAGVTIGPHAVINQDVVIGEGTEIMAHAYVDRYVRIGANCRIFPSAVIGTEAQDLKFEGAKSGIIIGDNVIIREFVTVNRATTEGGQTVIGDGCFLMAYSHVAHECRLGRNVIMVNYAGLAGHVIVEDEVTVGGFAAIHQFVRLGTHSFIGLTSRVLKDVPPYLIGQGADDFKLYGPNSIGLRRKGFSIETIRSLKEVFRLIFRDQRPLQEALDEVLAEFSDVPEAVKMVEFIQASKRGVYR